MPRLACTMGRVRTILESVLVAGELVSLRPHAAEDAAPAFELVHEQDAILRWLEWSGPSDPAELAAFYRAWRVSDEQAEDYHFAVCRREDGALVGSLALRSIGHPGTANLGYWIGQPYWNRGYASEAVRLACWLAFRWLRAQAITSWVFRGNDASRRVLEKNGFRYVRTSWRPTARGGRRAEWSLALLATSWEDALAGWRPAREEIRRLGEPRPAGARSDDAGP